MVRELTASLPGDANEAARLAALNRFLFTEQGFHGSRGDYYHRSNSYLNAVIDAFDSALRNVFWVALATPACAWVVSCAMELRKLPDHTSPTTSQVSEAVISEK